MNKKIFLALLVIVLGAVDVVHAAGMRAQDVKGNSVTVEAAPCESDKARALLPKLSQIMGLEVKPEMLGRGTLMHLGHASPVCWLYVGDAVIVLDENEHIFRVPVEYFSPADTV